MEAPRRRRHVLQLCVCPPNRRERPPLGAPSLVLEPLGAWALMRRRALGAWGFTVSPFLLGGQTQLGGSDEVDFFPDSVERGSVFDDGEFVPDSESQHAVSVKEQRPLQRMMREWKRLLEDEQVDSVKVVAEDKPSNQNAVMEEREMPSIEDAETDDEGVDLRGHSQVEEYEALEDDETLQHYIDDVVANLLPAYNQVSKFTDNKD